MELPEVTIRDVAARAGVSPGTASRALRGHPQISEACIARVRDAAEALSYKPLRDRTGRRRRAPLAGKRIAIVMLGIDRTLASLPAVAESIHGAEEALAAAGAHPTLIDVPDPTDPPRALRRVRFDGILAKAALQGDIADAIGSKFRGVLESNAMVWMLGRPSGMSGDAVGPDDAAMGQIAAEALVAAGHTRVPPRRAARAGGRWRMTAPARPAAALAGCGARARRRSPPTSRPDGRLCSRRDECRG
jgi:LacI family transcriptional regulator